RILGDRAGAHGPEQLIEWLPSWEDVADLDPKSIEEFEERQEDIFSLLAIIQAVVEEGSQKSRCGQRRKDVALRYLFPENQIPPGHPSLQLDVDNRTLFADHPFLFAQCDPHITPLDPVPDDGVREEIPIHWASFGDRRLSDIILARVLFLFVDVICIFADDIGGLDAVRTSLSTWATVGRSASSLEHRPRVLIVAEANGSSVTHDLLDESDFLFLLMQDRNAMEVFSTPSLLHLPGGDLSSMARHRPLRDELLKAVDLSRRHRKEDGYLFSAAHLDRFFHYALTHVCRTPQLP
ncbi:hypothetical protein KXX35_000530, partial [Aspergillus fumigatus]